MTDNKSAEKFFGRYTIYGVDREHDQPYMTRYWFGRLRLHIFHRGDNDPDPHDHPWNFWTFPLTSYVEEVINPIAVEAVTDRGSIWIGEAHRLAGWSEHIIRYRQVVPAWRWTYRPATHTHRVIGRYDGSRHIQVNDGPWEPGEVPGKIVTIVWRGGGKRKWGFLKNRDGRWCWVPWRKYVYEGGKHGPCE